MGWVRICDENSLNEGDIKEFDHNDTKILIARIKGKIYATDRICTHAYADLSTGFLDVEEETVTCPLHMSTFKLENGTPQNPPAESPLKTYDTKTEDGVVYAIIK